ncbi:MAG: AAA family ATPase, partial [bacterium]|nr:AAA family ATPase [bacterium]
LHNRCMVLSLDFSIIDPTGGIEDIRHRFNRICNMTLQNLVWQYKKYFGDVFSEINRDEDASSNLNEILLLIRTFSLPELYVIIDEYDNFANQLITANKDTLYRELTADDSFLKNFFKTLKNGTKSGAISRIFITGVLPITIDDLSSGYNIANFLTLDPTFEIMMGFTLKETETLLDEIYMEHQIAPATRPLIMETITANYNGYRIIDHKGK